MCWRDGLPGLGARDKRGVSQSLPLHRGRQTQSQRLDAKAEGHRRDARVRGRTPNSGDMYPETLQNWFFPLSSSRTASNKLWGPCCWPQNSQGCPDSACSIGPRYTESWQPHSGRQTLGESHSCLMGPVR